MSSRVYPNGSDYTLLLFLSHSWAYGHHRDGLHNLLAPDWLKGIEYKDLSVPSAHPLDTSGDLELLRQLSDRIRQCDALLIMAGMYANFSEWMKSEITLAVAHGKPILAIAPNGQERLAGAAMQYTDYPVVRWRGASIRDAVLNVIDAQVRANFLAAKQMRLDEFIESMTPAPSPPSLDFSFFETAPPRRSAAEVCFNPWATPTPAPLNAFSDGAFDALEQFRAPSVFDFLEPKRSAAGTSGFLDLFPKKP